MSFGVLLYEESGPVDTITLNRSDDGIVDGTPAYTPARRALVAKQRERGA